MPFPARIPGDFRDFPKRVRICADGRCGKVDLVYYDRLHTGDSYDELQVSLDDGKCVRGPANLFEAVEDEALVLAGGGEFC